MQHTRLPVPEAPITDRLVEALIETIAKTEHSDLTAPEAALILQATPGCLRELLAYRRLLGRQYAAAWIEGAADMGPNVVRLADNRPAAPADPRGAA